MPPTRQPSAEPRDQEVAAYRSLRALAYLVLLRAEIARFTRIGVAPSPTRLCCSDPHLTVESR
jgi:hypothetical protein